jgi:glycosyltransferase involved in cell wall biosynthesis
MMELIDRPRIAYLTVNDPADRRSWSGTHFYIAKALKRHCGEVVPIGPVKPASLFFRKAARKLLRRIGKTYLFTHTESFAKEIAGIVNQRLEKAQCDLVFAPAGSAPLAYLNTKVPIAYLSDTTFAAILNYYPEFSHVSQSVIAQANRVEKLAIQKSKWLIYSSQWAARSACKDYDADPAKISVIPFGANLDQPPSVERIATRVESEICRLLFVGIDWAKKGGDIAFETLIELEHLGIPTKLTVVGCTPPKSVTHKKFSVFPFLSKNDSQQRLQLEALYLDADFFILPTRADCSPIVLCEANAFGLPAISTDTGGVPDLIRNGENGFLLPMNATGAEYAKVIAGAFGNKQKLQQLRAYSRQAYDERLNWDAWGQTVASLISKPKSFSQAAGQ